MLCINFKARQLKKNIICRDGIGHFDLLTCYRVPYPAIAILGNPGPLYFENEIVQSPIGY